MTQATNIEDRVGEYRISNALSTTRYVPLAERDLVREDRPDSRPGSANGTYLFAIARLAWDYRPDAWGKMHGLRNAGTRCRMQRVLMICRIVKEQPAPNGRKAGLHQLSRIVHLYRR